MLGVTKVLHCMLVFFPVKQSCTLDQKCILLKIVDDEQLNKSLSSNDKKKIMGFSSLFSK